MQLKKKKYKSSWVDKLVQWSPLIIASILLSIAFYMYKNQKEFIDNSTLTMGLVLGYKLESRGSNSVGQRSVPRIWFYTKDSVPTYFYPSVNSDFSWFSIDEQVEVLYPKNNPEDAQVNSFWQLWFHTVIIAFLGLVFLCIGIGMAFYTTLVEVVTYKEEKK